MPQTPQIETKTKTSQITGIIAAVAAAIGIGALIYFAVVNYNTKVTEEATLPLFEQEYQPNVELVSSQVTDKTTIADTQAKYEQIASSIIPIVEKQAQDTGTTTAQVVNEVQKDILVQQAAESNVTKTTTLISEQINTLVDNGTIDSYQVQPAEELALQATYDKFIGGTGDVEFTSPYTEFTSSQIKDIQLIGDTVVNEVTQLNDASSAQITEETNSDANTTSNEMNAIYTKELNRIVNYTSVSNDSEISYTTSTENTDNQALTIASSGISYYYCSPTDSSNLPINWTVGKTSETYEDSQAGADECSQAMTSKFRTSQYLAVDESVTCYNNESDAAANCNNTAKTYYYCGEPNSACALVDRFTNNKDCVSYIETHMGYDIDTCYSQKANCICGESINEPTGTQYTFFACYQGAWNSNTFEADNLDAARLICINTNHPGMCYQEGEAGYQEAADACQQYKFFACYNGAWNSNTFGASNLEDARSICENTNNPGTCYREGEAGFQEAADACPSQTATSTQYTFSACYNGVWESRSIASDPNAANPLEAARISCQTANNVEKCYLETDADFQTAQDACQQPQAVSVVFCDLSPLGQNHCGSLNMSMADCLTQFGENRCFNSVDECATNPISLCSEVVARCENNACIEKRQVTDSEPCANGDPELEAAMGCYSDIASCQASDCEPKQEYYYCETGVGCQTTMSTQEACNSQYGVCYPTSDANSSATCDSACNKQETQTLYYCDTSIQTCNKINPDECLGYSVNGTKSCSVSSECCQSTVVEKTSSFNYCDQNDKTNGCKRTEEFSGISDLEILRKCETKYGVNNCITGKQNICDATCQPDPVSIIIKDECAKNLPNNPNCPQNIVRVLEEQPTEITEPKLAISSSIIYRGLGRVIVKFWADPNDLTNFAYTEQKLINDFKDNKLRVRFSSKKENLTDVLKVYKDPRNPNKYYAIAYKLNVDNLWQNDDGNYKSKKYFYQIDSNNKKSDFFDFKSLQRGGEVLYVKNRLYNGKYDLKKYGTIELNLKNKGQVAADIKKLNNKFKNFENGGVYFWTESSKVSPFGLRTAMAGDQRYKQFYSILKNLQKKNNINKAVKVLYNYHDRLKPTDIYRRYDNEGVKYWAKQVQKGNLSFGSMVTYVMLGTDEPRTNLQQFWGTGKQGLRKADIELSFVKSLSRGITQMSDISRFMNATKYPSTASIRADLRNSDEFRRLLKDVYKRGGTSDAISLLYIAVLGRPVDPDGQPYYVNKFDKLKKDGLNATDALTEIDKELTGSSEYKNALKRPIK